ncbi:hypothetical protein HZS93_00550 [Xanthomonas citri]|nr:hypothetical protein CLM98_03150 [Xanthomonas citri pv. citri]AYL19407.1 hypothetical protein COR42_02705 [Xanthomonas citri pv. citri]AYL23846.1 hypothetical protein CPA10_02700 [Xanthomonas citri pv. citri]QYF43298.1 hypothetical protein HZS93_00550 [Xanthomonas citri]
MVGTLLWLNHLEACPMRAPSSTAWPTKRLISQEEMWGNLSVRVSFFSFRFCLHPRAARSRRCAA